MTTAFNSELESHRQGPSEPVKTAAIVVLGLAVAGLLVLAAFTFLGLAVAGPIALTVADSVSVFVSPSDVAIATQLATMWPLFAAAAVGFAVAALVTLVKLIQRIDRSPVA